MSIERRVRTASIRHLKKHRAIDILFYKFPCKLVDKFDTSNTENLSEKECAVLKKTLAEL